MSTPGPGDPPLTFSWARARGRGASLTFWMMVTAIVLVAFFALFRIVYPQSQRSIPSAQQIVILDGTDPATQRALNPVRDRDFMILPGGGDRNQRVTLESAGPVFHPSFEKRELRLLDLPQGSGSIPPVRLHDLSAPVLPPLDLSDMKSPAAARQKGASRTGIVVSGPLAARKIEEQPDFSAAAPAEPEAWRFQITADALGRVVFALPLDTPGKLDEAGPTLKLLRAMRFDKSPDGQTGALQSGIVTFRSIVPAP